MGDGCLVGWTSGARARGPSMAYHHHPSFLLLLVDQLPAAVQTFRTDMDEEGRP